MWGFFDEYWSAITSSTVAAGEHTVDWFQNIGLAVAGAIGNLFNFALRFFNDAIIFFGWIFSLIGNIITIFLLPITWIFSFLKALLLAGFASPTDTNYTWLISVNQILESVPYWTELMTALTIGLSIAFIFYVFRRLENF